MSMTPSHHWMVLSLPFIPPKLDLSSIHPNRNNSGGRSKGSASPVTPSSDKLVCQICGRSYHSAIDCYQRMNHVYQGKIPPKKLQALIATQAPQPRNNTWYTDSGASSHITSNLTNLSLKNE